MCSHARIHSPQQQTITRYRYHTWYIPGTWYIISSIPLAVHRSMIHINVHIKYTPYKTRRMLSITYARCTLYQVLVPGTSTTTRTPRSKEFSQVQLLPFLKLFRTNTSLKNGISRINSFVTSYHEESFGRAYKRVQINSTWYTSGYIVIVVS